MSIFDNIFSGKNGVANTLVDLFGTSAYFVSSSSAKVYDPRTDTYTSGNVSRVPIMITPPTKYKSYELANSSIKSTDCKATVKATDIISEINNGSDYIEYQNSKYIIVESTKVITGAQVAVITLQLRKVV